MSKKEYKIIDLSVSVDPANWEPNPVEVTRIDHKKGADILGKNLVVMQKPNIVKYLIEYLKYRLGFGFGHKDFPDEKGLSISTYKITTHTGTHLDAPLHYGDNNNDGCRMKSITDIPLEWCFSNGVLIDLEDNKNTESISKNELTTKLKLIGYEIKPFDIILLKTGGDVNIGKPDYFIKYRGISAEATEYLIDRGVKVIGIDSFGFDPPFYKMITKYMKTQDKKYLWPAHILGRKKEYCHIERLTNLGAISKPFGFMVSCFPIKLVSSDAGWCRVVAIENY